jgi:hypothetical protein
MIQIEPRRAQSHAKGFTECKKPLTNLIKFPYFADTIERGHKGMKAEGIGGEREHKGVKAEGIGGERDGDFTDNFNVRKGFHIER